MKIIANASKKVFRATALFGLAALLGMGPAAFAGNDRGRDEVSGELKAVAYTSNNSLKMKVNFENPAREKVTLSILAPTGQVVYTTTLGDQEIYNGKVDLSSLADGNYTLALQSKSSRYTKPFEIKTQTARQAVVQ
jgi:hypothetical protein